MQKNTQYKSEFAVNPDKFYEQMSVEDKAKVDAMISKYIGKVTNRVRREAVDVVMREKD